MIQAPHPLGAAPPQAVALEPTHTARHLPGLRPPAARPQLPAHGSGRAAPEHQAQVFKKQIAQEECRLRGER